MNSNDYLKNYIRIDKLLKETQFEKTEKIHIVDSKGESQGPFIRKTFKENCGLGEIYKVLLNEKNVGVNTDNIPEVLYVNKQDENIIVVEEFYDGITLDKFLKKTNFDIKILNKIFLDLCNAVDCLHTAYKKPIIHRDIKPENILICDDGNKVILIDLGIARTYEQDSKSDTHKFGTKGYAAPEQYGFSQTDVRSDIYSLGKVLEFMMNNNNWANNVAEIPNNIYKEILNKATQFAPEKRYRTVNALIIEFKSAAKGGSWVLRISENKNFIFFGHFWNAFLTLVYLFFIVATIFVAIEPSTQSVMDMSVGEKIVYCIMTILFILFPIYFILLFKPSLRKIFKSLPRLKFIHYLAFAIACSSAVLILGLIGQLL